MSPKELNRLRDSCFARAARRMQKHGVYATSDVIGQVAHQSVIQAIWRTVQPDTMNIAEHYSMMRGWGPVTRHMRERIKSNLLYPYPHKRDGWIVASKFRRPLPPKASNGLPVSPSEEVFCVSTSNRT